LQKETVDFSKIIDEGKPKVKEQPKFKPNGTRIALRPEVKVLDLNERWMRLAHPKSKWQNEMVARLVMTMECFPLILEKVKRAEEWHKQQLDGLQPQPNIEGFQSQDTAENDDDGKK